MVENSREMALPPFDSSYINSSAYFLEVTHWSSVWLRRSVGWKVRFFPTKSRHKARFAETSQYLLKSVMNKTLNESDRTLSSEIKEFGSIKFRFCLFTSVKRREILQAFCKWRQRWKDCISCPTCLPRTPSRTIAGRRTWESGWSWASSMRTSSNLFASPTSSVGGNNEVHGSGFPPFGLTQSHDRSHGEGGHHG